MAATSLPPRTDQSIEPPFEWVRKVDRDTLVLDVSGFKKEQLKVQVHSQGKNLKVGGERFIYGNQRISFLRDFRIPENCNISEIRAKFQNGILYVVMPKSIASTSQPPPAATTTTTTTSTADDDGRTIRKSEHDGGGKPPSMEARGFKEEHDGRKWEDGGGGRHGNEVGNVQGDEGELRRMVLKNLLAILVLLGLWIYFYVIRSSSSRVEKHEMGTQICNI